MSNLLIPLALALLGVWILSDGLWLWRTAARQRDMFWAVLWTLTGAHMIYRAWLFGGAA
jgi:hypothetical protein